MTYEFEALDYLVGIAVMLVPVGIGVGFAVRDKDKATREEYLLGGRDMHLLPVAMSIFITFMSAVSLIGVPAEVYQHGSMYVWLGLGLGLSYIVGLVTVVPLLYPLQLTSIYQYLHLRYKSNAVRMLSTCMGMLTTILHTGAAALLAPAFALEASADIPLWVSVVLVGSIGTLYTAIGGIKSVVWTDAFQTIIVFFGIFISIVKGVMAVGSVETVYELASSNGRTMMDNTEFDPRSRMTIYGCIVGGMFMWLVNGFNQSTIQRIGAMRSMKQAKVAFFLNFNFVFFYNIILVILGNVIFAFIIYQRCDPVASGELSNSNQIAPYFVLSALEDIPGMAGFYVATLCCGTLSTISSGINALAANTVEDVLKRPLSGLSEAAITLATKGFVVLHGCLVIGLAYAAQYIEWPVTQMAGTVLAACGSPVLGLFLIGAAVPWANKYGAMAGALTAFSFNFWIGIGQLLDGCKSPPMPGGPTDQCPALINGSAVIVPVVPDAGPSYITTTQISNQGDDSCFFLYDVSYEWYGFTGTVISCCVGLVVSALTRGWDPEASTTEPRYIFPFLHRVYGMESVTPLDSRVPRECMEMGGTKDKNLISNPGYTPMASLSSDGGKGSSLSSAAQNGYADKKDSKEEKELMSKL